MVAEAPDVRSERLYYKMALIRAFEEHIAAIYPTDAVKSPIHLSIGQEAPAVAVCEVLRPEDAVFGTYRGHALYIARGGNLRAMAAELFGKANGCGRGKAGSMHLGAPEVGMMFTSAIVATGAPNAMGYAFALKYRQQPGIVVCMVGDGAVDEGVWAESLNFSALKGLPILWVVENNLYAIHAPLSNRMPRPNFCQRAEAYGIPASRIAEQDADVMVDGFAAAAEAVRDGQGPRFVEVETYRWREHVGPNEDTSLGYRTAEELAVWKDKDCLKRCAGNLDVAVLSALDTRIASEVADALAFAEASPYPDDEDLLRHVFHDGGCV
ncbi:MAG: thiamine pyrophosphate-dependent dehydrogenase E1 component subunit alpha [Rhodospirillaceae bacterium]|nr:thiamine pyrophosphate-dependent dehydrogenase E1 component subunit alpha [Rhodospirillaceae bacterium]